MLVRNGLVFDFLVFGPAWIFGLFVWTHQEAIWHWLERIIAQ